MKKLKLSAFIMLSFILGLITPLLYLNHYFHLDQGKMVVIKSFPSWGKTFQYKNSDYNAAITSSGIVVNGNDSDLNFVHIIRNNGEVWVYFDGDQSQLRVERR